MDLRVEGLLLDMARPQHNDRHANETDCDPDKIPCSWPNRVNEPQPKNSDTDINATIRGIDSARRGGVQREQPSEQDKACGSRK